MVTILPCDFSLIDDASDVIVNSDRLLEKVEENRAGGYILANRSISFRSYGERLAIFIDPIDASRTKVEVVSKKAVPGTLFTMNWPYKIFEALEKRFKIE